MTSTMEWAGGKRISQYFRNGKFIFLPGNDSVCVHMHSVAAEREEENIGVGFFQFNCGGVDATGYRLCRLVGKCVCLSIQWIVENG